MAILDNAVWLTGTGGTAESGSTTVSENGNSVLVTGTFTASAWDASQGGNNVSEFGAFAVTSPITAAYDFSQPVSNLSFTIDHLNDDGGSTYDDMWTIYAYDENGDLIDSATVIAGLTNIQDESVTVNPDGSVSIEAQGTISNDVGVSLAGPVSNLSLVYEPGSGGSSTGGSGISDLSFDIPDTDTDGDGILDSADLDDDNDGILDTDEGYSETIPSTITITIDGDNNSSTQTTWELRDPDGNLIASDTTIGSGTEVTNVPSTIGGDYTLTIFDSGGDGLSGGGPSASYSVAVDGVTVVASGNKPDFGSSVAETFTLETTYTSTDSDGDGIADHLDLDSDNDGITDNVEARATDDYVAPSGIDANNDGLDDAYATGVLTPIDTDNDGIADFLDTDSDNDGLSDAEEAGHGITQAAIDASGDADFDGIKDVVDDVVGRDVNDADVDGAGNFTLSDSDNDVAADGSNANAPLRDFDFRDSVPRDYIVEGTSGDDLIDAAYDSDPEGDQIDALDHSDGSNTDVVYGGEGSDTILGGQGDDVLYGGGPTGTAGIGGTDTASDTYTVISLGTAAEIDTDDSNTTAENAAALLGSYGGPGAELYNSLQTMVTNDVNGDTNINSDNAGDTPETFTIDGVPYSLDSGVVYDATVTFTDGTTGTFTAVVIQTTTGETFMVPELSDNADNTLLTSKPIESISLDAVAVDATQIVSDRVDADYQQPVETDTSGDVIDGGVGADTIYGGGGGDTITGGDGDDALYLGDGDNANDTVVLADGSGTDTVHDFTGPTDNGDGTYTGFDQFDVTNLTDAGGNPVNFWDVTVSDTNGDGTGDAILTFPNGETVTLVGITPDQVDTLPEMQAIGIPCFTPGILIATEEGEKPVEDIRPGDRVLTADNGFQTVRWVGARSLDATELAANPHLRPVVIRKGAFGNARTMRVSPQHAFVMNHTRSEQLIRAKHAAESLGGKIARVDQNATEVTYIHIMFDRHEVIFAEGARTESFYPGPMAISGLERAAQAELLQLFPELVKICVGAAQPKDVWGAPARPYLRRRDALKVSRRDVMAEFAA